MESMKMNFDVLLNNRPENIQLTAKALREVIISELPELNENIYGGKKVQNALYSKHDPNRVVCGMQTNNNYCMLYLHKTNDVDTGNLKLEGKGKHAKHVKYTNPDEINKPLIKKILKDINQIL